MDVETIGVLAHAASTLFLVGTIWTVQVVHYPLMSLVGEDRFVAYAAAHSPRMAGVVMVPWTVQGITTAWLLLAAPEGVPPWLVMAAAVAAAIPVIVTVFVSVPAHVRLGDGFDTGAHRTLVRTNWIRTLAWTAHAPVALAIVVRAG